MDKINWKEKLSSRKFWMALVGFATSIMYAFNVADITVEKVSSVITAGSIVVIYILVEGSIDSNRE